MTRTEVAQPTAGTPPLAASASTDGNTTVVSFRGEADLFTLPVVVDVLVGAIADSDGPVVVDLTDVKFIDTAAMRALARAWQFLDDRGRTMTLRSPSRLAARVAGHLGLADLIEANGARAV